MKITAPTRVAPDGSHILDPALFGDDDRFELSTIRAEDASIAMEMLIGNYASPMDAVIRELYINGSDSHRAAGQTRPVEITMPTEEHPFLVVRDFGIGLSADDMVEVFTRPAASTKRGDNLATGGLGIGAKSPFTVADRFVVRGVKNGIAATLVMARIDEQLKHLVNEITAAPEGSTSGVEVTVPIEVSTIERWWKALARVHFWWDRGGALITNAALSPVALPTWWDRILDGQPAPEGPALLRGSEQRSFIVLMGQIAYKIPEDISPSWQPVIYALPVGTVSVAPTRESIVATDENAQVLKSLLHAWQDEQFSELATTVMDPETSIVAIARIQGDLTRDGLVEHFEQWAARERGEDVVNGLLPRYGMSNAVAVLAFEAWADWRTGVVIHGIEGETARSRSLWDVVGLITGREKTPLVFLDSQTLPESRRRILTKWAKATGVIAVVVFRHRLENYQFSARWKRQADPATSRVFAHAGEIEWVDPEDVRVERPASKKAGPAPTGASEIEVIDMSTFGRERTLITVDDLVAFVKKRSNRWVLVDTVAELAKVDVRLPPSITAVTSGQRPSALLKSMLGDRALSVAKFTAMQEDFVSRAMTPAQRRTVADVFLSNLGQIRFYFGTGTSWIDETEDPAVRKIARKIATIVDKALSARQRVGSYSHSPRTDSGAEYAWALHRLTRNPQWLIDTGSLGAYAPALLAAQSGGLGGHSVGNDPFVIEHIRTTIATQLVKS